MSVVQATIFGIVAFIICASTYCLCLYLSDYQQNALEILFILKIIANNQISGYLRILQCLSNLSYFIICKYVLYRGFYGNIWNNYLAVTMLQNNSYIYL